MAEVITTISPVTNLPVATQTAPTAVELDQLIGRSNQVFVRHSTTSTLADRKRWVENMLGIMSEQRDRLGQVLTDFIGRPTSVASKEVDTAIMRGKYLLSVADRVLADTEGTKQDGFTRFIRKVPVGPVLIVFAWNFPYLILINSLVPALLAGNSVILKPSPQTPTIGDEIRSIVELAGFPAGLVQTFCTGDPKLVERAVQNESIAFVSFTGSVAGGLAVQKAATAVTSHPTNPRVGIRVGLELGGNDPAYVRSDVAASADRLAWVAAELVDGAIFNSGQSCCSIERVYVHADAYDGFVAAVVDQLRKKTVDSKGGWVLGDPRETETSIGPVISLAAATKIRAVIKQAIEGGATDVCPVDENYSFAGMMGKGSDLNNTAYVVPSVLVNVTDDMLVMREETFGPVLPIMKVTSDGEAIQKMNDSDLGLTASIWTTDLDAGQRLADKIEAGTVFVNRCDFPSPDLAWTGWKNSGMGQTLSVHGFDQFVKLKSYHLKDFPAVSA